MDEFETEKKRFRHRVSFVVGHCVEGRLKFLLQERVEGSVFSAEGAICDFAVCHPRTLFSDFNIDDRLVLALQMADLAIVVLDFKHISPIVDLREGRRTFWYSVNIKHAQAKSCHSFVIQNCLSPELAAVIPYEFLKNMCWNKDDFDSNQLFISQNMLLESAEVEPFAMEWSPFVCKQLSQLPKSLNELAAKATNTDLPDLHPSGICLEGWVPRPLGHAGLLRPTPSNWIQDLNVALKIRKLLQDSENYRFEFHTIAPSIGDFAVRHIPSSSYTTVEVKCRMAMPSSRNQCVFRHHNEYDERLVFSPLNQWQFLFSSFRNEPNKAVFVPRLYLPEHWFRSFARQVYLGAIDGSSHLKGCRREECVGLRTFLDTWTIDLDGDPVHVTKRLEKILSSQLVSGRFQDSVNMTFDRPIPRRSDDAGQDNAGQDNELLQGDVMLSMGSLTAIEPDLTVNDSDDDSELEYPVPDIEADEALTPGQFVQRAFEAEQHRWLSEMCRRAGWGAVYALGLRHPSATHVLVPGVQESTKPSFASLHNDTPMMLINFLEFYRVDHRDGSDLRRPWQSVRASHGDERSLYIFVPQQSELRSNHLYRYLVPSEAMVNKERVKMSEVVVENGRTADVTVSYSKVLPSKGESIDAYACRGYRMIDRLKEFWASVITTRERVAIGNQGFGVKIEAERYVVNKRTVVHGYMKYARGEILWDVHKEHVY